MRTTVKVLCECRRDPRMAVAVPEGRWNPTALFASVAAAIADRTGLAEVAAALAAPDLTGTGKAELLRRLLADVPLLVVFDDSEQNSPRGGASSLTQPSTICSPAGARRPRPGRCW